MPSHSAFRQAQFALPSAQEVADELTSGLMEPQARVEPKHLYDALGARLYEAITEVAEYSPTRDERALLDNGAAAIAQVLPRPCALVDLGAGSCRKAARLMDQLGEACPSHYVAVDISAVMLQEGLDRIRLAHPGMTEAALGLDFSHGLPEGALDAVLPPADELPRVAFYPGSSIGNFHPRDAQGFLAGLRQTQGVTGLIIGVDLVKPAHELVAAYDDALGVTAAFNLNLLRVLESRVGLTFELADWVHRSVFNDEASRVEMHLVARRPTRLAWTGGERRFAEGDSIHTENSYKYTVQGFSELLSAAGFPPREVLGGERFAVFVA